MQVKAQPLELKNTGIAFDVYGSGSKRLGDLAVTQTGLVWSKGASSRSNSKLTVKWNDFIGWMQSQMKDEIKAPAKTRAAAAKKAAPKKAPAKRAPAAKKAPARKKAN